MQLEHEVHGGFEVGHLEAERLEGHRVGVVRAGSGQGCTCGCRGRVVGRHGGRRKGTLSGQRRWRGGARRGRGLSCRVFFALLARRLCRTALRYDRCCNAGDDGQHGKIDVGSHFAATRQCRRCPSASIPHAVCTYASLCCVAAHRLLLRRPSKGSGPMHWQCRGDALLIYS
jgi:hypothetical protein